jgi:pimeloyl-ACP methyl ester carboxylesterase
MTPTHAAHFAFNGDTRLYYEAFGRARSEAVLLLGGAGRQSLDYNDAFCQRLAAEGLRVIRFDARDTGLSSHFADRPSRLVEVYDDVRAGKSPDLAYGLEDLANDAFAVLDSDGANSAHLFARSLGSGVAQMMALARPERVKTLMLVIAFSRGLADTMKRETLERIETETFTDFDMFVARQLRGAMAVGSPAYFDAGRVTSEARAAYARGVHSGGTARHFATGIAAPDMRTQLKELRVPTLIVHGALDRVIPLPYAQETNAAIAGSRLVVMDDMGHDGPPELQERWLELFMSQLGGQVHAPRFVD